MHFCLLFRYVCQLCLSSLDCFCWRLCTSPNIVSLATLTHRRKLYLQCTCCTIVKAVDRTGSVFVYTGSDAVQFHDRMDSIQWVLLSLLCNIKSRIVYFESQHKDKKIKVCRTIFGLFTNMFLSLVLDWNFSNMEHFLVYDFKKISIALC